MNEMEKQAIDGAVGNFQTLMARQPIFRPDLTIYGYELLYRADDDDSASIADDAAAQKESSVVVMINSLMDMDIEKITDGNIAFFNAPASMLVEGIELPLGGSKIGLDILDPDAAPGDLAGALQQLKLDDVVLVLDDFQDDPKMLELIDFVDIVKIDIASMSKVQLASILEKLSGREVLVAAKKVETTEQFSYCRELGFDLFQGFFLSKPTLVKSARLPDSKVNILRIIAKLQEPDVDVEEVEAIIRLDVALHFRLLRTVNSAYYGLPVEMKSIARAVTYLGLTTIRRWIQLQLAASSGSIPGELIRQALIRARMCELLTRDMPKEAQDTAFTIGLFSLLDSMLEVPMDEVLSQLPLVKDLAIALTQRDGPYGRLLEAVIRYERGEWKGLAEGLYAEKRLAESYLEAVQWAGEQYRLLTET